MKVSHWSVVGLLVLGGCTQPQPPPPEKSIEYHPKFSKDYVVSTSVPVSEKNLDGALRRVFGARPEDPQFQNPHTLGMAQIPGLRALYLLNGEQIRSWKYTGKAQFTPWKKGATLENPALERFLRTSPESRGKLYWALSKNDPSGRWYSEEYFLSGRPMVYSSSFILELRPDPKGKAGSFVLEIYTFGPFVEAGMMSGTSPHSFGSVALADYRDVNPEYEPALKILKLVEAQLKR